MLILKYARTGSAAFLPHLDVLRLFGRITRRAGLEVRYSEGFHPHLQFWFGNPVSLGIPTLSEYCAADSPEAPEDFRNRFNEKSVPGLEILVAARAEKNPNFADILCAAEYECSAPGIGNLAEEIRSVAEAPGFVVRYGDSGREKSGADKFLGLRAQGPDALSVRLKAGRDNLKPDMWLAAVSDALGRALPCIPKKVRQFYATCGELRDADELFAGSLPPKACL